MNRSKNMNIYSGSSFFGVSEMGVSTLFYQVAKTS